ncbi:MAG TPA: hypothetical protein DIT94_09225, partial [Deltaproteobacteria bacterium]|nr:hypothetical protein [Deltaproteobacteria bacterium]
GKKNVNPQVNGSSIAEAVPDNKEAAKLVSALHKEPSNSVARLQLVNTVMGASSAHSLTTNKDMMLQAAIPIYLGDVTQTYLQVVVHAYKNYHEKLMNLHKQNMMSIRSSVLKNVNMSGIDVSDEDQDDTNIKNTEAMMTEIQVSEALIERTDEILNNIKTKMSTSLSREEIEDISSTGKAAASFFGGGGGDDSQNTQKQNMVIGKSVQVLSMLQPVPLLQGAGLDLSKTLQAVDNKIPYPLVMEGRVHQQVLKYFLLRIESGDRTARDNMAPTYNKALVSFRKAMKLVSKTAPKKADLPVLTEFANLTFYGFIHRDLMRFTKDGVLGLVKLGKEAADAAVTVDESFAPLQKRIEKSLNQLDSARQAQEA